ncbi:hypothetical protein V8E36_006977 [Tilletia maclaganii]
MSFGYGSRKSGHSSPVIASKWRAFVKKVPNIRLPTRPKPASMVIGTPHLRFAPGHVITALEEGVLTPAGMRAGSQWKPPAPGFLSRSPAMRDVLPMPVTVSSLTSPSIAHGTSPSIASSQKGYTPNYSRRPMHAPTSVPGFAASQSGRQAARSDSASAMQAAMDRWGVGDIPMSSSEGSSSSGPVPTTTSGSSFSALSAESTENGHSTRRSSGEDTSPRRPRRPTLSIIKEGNEAGVSSSPRGAQGRPPYGRNGQPMTNAGLRTGATASNVSASYSNHSGASSAETPAAYSKASFETARGTISSNPGSVRRIHRVAAPSIDQFMISAGINADGSPRKTPPGIAQATAAAAASSHKTTHTGGGANSSNLIASLGELPLLPTFTSLQFSTDKRASAGMGMAPPERKAGELSRSGDFASIVGRSSRSGGIESVSHSTSSGTNASSSSSSSTRSGGGGAGHRAASSSQQQYYNSTHRQSETFFPSRPSSGIVASAALLATLAEMGDLPTLPSLPSIESARAGAAGSEAANASAAISAGAGDVSRSTNSGSVQDLSQSRSVPSSCTTMNTALDGDSQRSFPQPPPPESEKTESPSKKASGMAGLPVAFSPELLASKSPFVSPYHKTVFPDKLEYDPDQVALQQKKASIAPVLAAYLAESSAVAGSSSNPASPLLPSGEDRSNGSLFGTQLAFDLKNRASLAGNTLKAKLKPSMSSLGSTAVSSQSHGGGGAGVKIEDDGDPFVNYTSQLGLSAHASPRGSPRVPRPARSPTLSFSPHLDDPVLASAAAAMAAVLWSQHPATARKGSFNSMERPPPQQQQQQHHHHQRSSQPSFSPSVDFPSPSVMSSSAFTTGTGAELDFEDDDRFSVFTASAAVTATAAAAAYGLAMGGDEGPAAVSSATVASARRARLLESVQQYQTVPSSGRKASGVPATMTRPPVEPLPLGGPAASSSTTTIRSHHPSLSVHTTPSRSRSGTMLPLPSPPPHTGLPPLPAIKVQAV